MQLMHREIDVFPGKRAQQPIASPTGRASGASTLVHLRNLTPQENAFRVYVKSGTNVLSSSADAGNSYWQDEWVSLKATDPPENDGSFSDASGGSKAPLSQTPGKQDQYGPNGRWTKVFVPRGGTRDILVSFNLPERPDSRAGIYPFTVVVEMSVTSDDGSGGLGTGAPPKPQEIPAVLYVQPFEKMNWELDAAPQEKKVGFLRRRTEMSLVVRNRSNDWLYCDVELPRTGKDLELQTFIHRVAVRPPEPSETETERLIPLGALCKIRTLRGEHHALPLGISARRVDAPSVPPPPSPDKFTGMDNGAVIAREMPGEPEVKLPPDRAVLYCPPIPASVTGFFTWVTGNIKALLAAVVGLYILVALLFAGLHSGNWMKAKTTTNAAPDGMVVVTGTQPYPFVGSRFFVRELGKPDWESLEDDQIKWGMGSGVAAPIPSSGGGSAPPAMPTLPSKLMATVHLDAKKWNGRTVQLGIRAGAFPFNIVIFPDLFMHPVLIKGDISVGNPDAGKPEGGPDTSGRTATASGELFVGMAGKDVLTIKVVPPLKAKPQSVTVGSDDYLVLDFTPKLRVQAPKSAQSAPRAPVLITESDGKTLKVDGDVKVNGADAIVAGAAGGVPPLGGLPPDPNAPPVAGANGANGGGSASGGTPNGGPQTSSQPVPPPNNNNGGEQPPPVPSAASGKSLVTKCLTDETPDWGKALETAQNTIKNHPELKNDMFLVSAEAYAILKVDATQTDEASRLMKQVTASHKKEAFGNPGMDAAMFWSATSLLLSAQNQPESAAKALKNARTLDESHELPTLTQSP